MTDARATKHDPRERELSVDMRLAQIDARFDHFEKHFDKCLEEHTARVESRLADLERRLALRLGSVMVAGIAVVSALVRML